MLHAYAGQVAVSDKAACIYIVRYKGIESVSADMLHVVLYLCGQCAEIQEAVQHCGVSRLSATAVLSCGW